MLGIAAGCFLLLMLVAGRYGYHRDELYFVAASKHLAWGYVDQPPLRAWRSCGWRATSSATRLRPPAVPGARVRGGCGARGPHRLELGGRRFAQTLAALLLGVSPFLIMGHMAGPTMYDLVGWAVVMRLASLRILRTGDEHLWLLVGPVVGVSLYAKHTIMFLVIALMVGLVVDRRWKVLGSPYLWAAAAIAIVLWVPNLLWQADNGWPTLAMSAALREKHSGVGYSTTFVMLQFVLPGAWAAPVWLAGLWALLRDRRSARTARSPGRICFCSSSSCWRWATGRTTWGRCTSCCSARGRSSRPAWSKGRAGSSQRRRRPATGAARCGARRPPRTRGSSSSRPLPSALAAGAAGALAGHRAAAGDQLQPGRGDRLAGPHGDGGRHLRRPRRRRSGRAPSSSPGNYGEAGALQRYGGPSGCPPSTRARTTSTCGGAPPDDATTVIVVGMGEDPRWLDGYFDTVERVATIDNAAGVDNEEQGQSIWLCRGPVRPWGEMWPEFQHYD